MIVGEKVIYVVTFESPARNLKAGRFNPGGLGGFLGEKLTGVP